LEFFNQCSKYVICLSKLKATFPDGNDFLACLLHQFAIWLKSKNVDYVCIIKFGMSELADDYKRFIEIA
jgi:hypothetical protein